MADNVLLNLGSGGATLHTDDLGGAPVVQVQRIKVGSGADGAYLDASPSVGLPVEFAVVVAHSDYVTSASLAAGSNVDLDGTTIPAATTGKLLRVTMGSSVPCKWEIKTRDGGSVVVKAVVFTGDWGIGSLVYQPVSKDMITLAGAGVDENFRVTATNLSANQAGDVHTTIEWDEV